MALIGDLVVVAVVHRPCHHEELVVVALQLGTLVRLDDVLDDELMDAEFSRYLRHLRFERLVQAYPHEAAAVFFHGLQRAVRGKLTGQRLAVDEHSAVLNGTLDRHGKTRRIIVRSVFLAWLEW